MPTFKTCQPRILSLKQQQLSAFVDQSQEKNPNADDYDPETWKALRKIVASPAIFCEAVLGLRPFPYQKKFLEDRSRKIIVCAGRQVGKSLIVSSRALWFAITHPETNSLIISATQRQSIQMYDKILRYVEESDLLSKAVRRKTRTEIEFQNRSRIIALPCGDSGKTLRTYTAHFLIIDEAAFVPEVVITEVAMPMLVTTRGTIIMISTPFDRNHIFFKAFNSDTWSRYHFKTYDNPLADKKYIDEQRSEIGEARYRREYLAEFVDDDRTMFTMLLLRSCIHVCRALPCEYCDTISAGKSFRNTDRFAGYDPGGLRDPAALVVVERFTDKVPAISGGDTDALRYRIILAKTFKSSDAKGPNVYGRFTVQVADYHKQLKFRKLFVDSTGLGSPIVEHCKDLGLPAEGITLSASAKEELLTHLKLLLDQGEVILPDDLDLLSSLNSIEADRSRDGRYYFDHPSGTQDDLAWATALAMWAAHGTPSGPGVYIVRY